MSGPTDETPLGFRPLTRIDFPLLAAWFAAPHVEPWWQEPSGLDALEANYGPVVDGTDPTEVRIVTLGEVAVGLVQRYLLADEGALRTTLAPTGVPLDAFGIDYLIGDPHLTGRGVGTSMIDRFVSESWDRYPGCAACVVAVHQDNRPSWRALERAGFTRVWGGRLVSDDPSDAGPQVAYLLRRPRSDGSPDDRGHEVNDRRADEDASPDVPGSGASRGNQA